MKNPPQGWCPWRVPLESLYFVFISIKTHKSLGFGNLPWYDFISILYPIGGAVVKNLPADAGDTRDMDLIPGLGRFPWRRKWQPTLVFLPGKSHEQRRLAGYSLWGRKRVRHNLATKQQKMNIKTWKMNLSKEKQMINIKNVLNKIKRRSYKTDNE